jgi:hypothetical protein
MVVPLLLSLSLAGVAPSGDAMWGNVGLGLYPTSSQKVAPNGLVYEPMFRLIGDVNVGSRDLYLFANSAYYTEKPKPGVTTNSSQGSFDFTKRQYDFNIGGAFATGENTEARFWAYSESNINRGIDQNKPSGYKDGFVGSLRYYFADEVVTRGYVGAGYYFTKELVDTSGQPYTPSFFTELNYTRPMGSGIHAYGQVILLGGRSEGIKEIDTQLGFTYKLNGSKKSTASLFFENDIGQEGNPERRRLQLEFSRSFQGN